MSLKTIAAATAYLVTSDAEEQSIKRRHGDGGEGKCCSGMNTEMSFLQNLFLMTVPYLETILGCQDLILIICCN
jgi:hypothetical protein